MVRPPPWVDPPNLLAGDTQAGGDFTRPVHALCVDPDLGPYSWFPGVQMHGLGVDAIQPIDPRHHRRVVGDCPVVAHPPCGGWGRLSHFYKGSPTDKALGPWCVKVVRANGGVLEHPKGSKLWATCGMPKPGEPPDQWGGWTLEVDQCDFDHPCRKATWLYIVGATAAGLPPLPPPGTPTHVIDTTKRAKNNPGYQQLPHLRKSWRHLTPYPLAAWLLKTARSTQETP